MEHYQTALQCQISNPRMPGEARHRCPGRARGPPGPPGPAAPTPGLGWAPGPRGPGPSPKKAPGPGKRRAGHFILARIEHVK